MTQNNLGTALGTLGPRESGTARLEEAVTACREALKERTRERVPLDWAMTQTNLGIALGTLGGTRESGTARLDEAVAAYDAALIVFVPARADYYTATCRAIETAIGNHSFRAIGITDYLERGGDINIAKRMAGHSNVKRRNSMTGAATK